MTNHRDSHDVEDSPGVLIFRVCQFLVTSSLYIGSLNLAIYLSPVRSFQIDDILFVSLDRGMDSRIFRLLFGYFFNIEGLFVS